MQSPLARHYPRHGHALRLWRLARALLTRGVPVLPGLLRLVVRALFQADIPLTADIPAGVVFMHNGLGTVVHPDVRFRGPALVFHNVTLGNNHGFREGAPVIGSHVMVGAGAAVLGPISVGDGCVIGANTVVNRDVPPFTLAAGNPARYRPVSLRALRDIFLGDLPPGAGTAHADRAA